jgi:hypothetical protein
MRLLLNRIVKDQTSIITLDFAVGGLNAKPPIFRRSAAFRQKLRYLIVTYFILQYCSQTCICRLTPAGG